MTPPLVRLSAVILSLNNYSDAFTAGYQRRPTIKAPSASPLRVSNTSEATKPVDTASAFDGGGSGTGDGDGDASWQRNLDQLLAPDTSAADRQVVLSDLLGSADEIQDSVRTALRERRIDGLLTPTQKRLQDGTRAVARQITSDILPGIAAVAAGEEKSPSNGSKKLKSPVDVLVEDLPTVVPRIGSRVLSALGNQAQRELEELRGDIEAGDPLRSLSRMQERTADVAAEAKNVFLETPEGLAGPVYRVLSRREGYEVRAYDAHTVASTSMSPVDEPYTMDDLASGGEAFNALAAYLFGANEEGEVMEMTTPVATTSSGEMRFYLKKGEERDSFPLPVAEHEEVFNEKGAVQIKEVPEVTLAVATFTGFVTEGEVARQKDALMANLEIDGVEIDVPHAAVVPHVILQYNPPYTIPILRRNEIGIAVRVAAGEEENDVRSSDLSEEWDVKDGAEDE